MAESGSQSNSLPGKDVRAPNVFERVKEEFEAVFQSEKPHYKETHGLNQDINENTSMSAVKAPNVFERGKEEIEALVEAIHPKNASNSSESKLRDFDKVNDFKDKSPELKEDKKNLPQSHHRETHGKSNDFDENTEISEVKGPNVFERAKEEIEAIIQTIHPKKDSSTKSGGLPISIGKGLEKLCSPRTRNKD